MTFDLVLLLLIYIIYYTMDVNHNTVGNELLDRSLLSLSGFFSIYTCNILIHVLPIWSKKDEDIDNYVYINR